MTILSEELEKIITEISTADILKITPTGKTEVIRIDADGKLFWHGREVETDTDFRSAMLELAKNLIRS